MKKFVTFKSDKKFTQGGSFNGNFEVTVFLEKLFLEKNLSGMTSYSDTASNYIVNLNEVSYRVNEKEFKRILKMVKEMETETLELEKEPVENNMEGLEV